MTELSQMTRQDKKIIIRGGGHKLFWIPMQYWGIILAVLSIIILFQNSIWIAVGVSVIFCAIIIIYIMKNSEKKTVEPTITVESELPHLTNEILETEDELLKRRAEKEDHSRFMPKY